MKKNIFSVLLAAVIFLPFAGGVVPAAALEENVVRIGVQDDFDSFDITTLTEHSDAADWAFTMMYDRFLYLDSTGTLRPDLAKRFEVIFEDVENPLPPEEVLLPLWPSGDPYELETDSSWDDFAVPGYDSNPGNVDENDLGPQNWGYSSIKFDKRFSHIEIELSDDLYFSDGSPLSTDDIIDMVNYAKRLPTNSIAKRQWQGVTIEFVSDYSFHMKFDRELLPYGLIDFLYSLASPSGSIFKAEGYNEYAPIGTGMFILTELEENRSATFERNPNWIAEDSPVYKEYGKSGTGELAQKIVFNHMSDSYLITSDIKAGSLQVGIAQGEEINVDEHYGICNMQVAGNPLALTFNPKLMEKTPYEGFIRRIIAHGFQRRMYPYDKYSEYMLPLMESSNDFWALGTWDDDPDYLLNLARNELAIECDPYPDVDLTLIYPQGNSYQSRIHYEEIASKIVFGLKRWNIHVFAYSEQDFNKALQSGNYDLALTEIDLMDINSAHKAFYGKVSDEMDKYLNYAKGALDVDLYGTMHISVQAECYHNVALINLGWVRNNVMLGYRMSGLTKPGKYCPTGDISRLDFRWLRYNDEE